MKRLNSIEVWEYPDVSSMELHCNEMEKDGYQLITMKCQSYSVVVTYQKMETKHE